MAEEQVQDQKTEEQKQDGQDNKQEDKQDSKVDARTTEALEILDILEDPAQRLAFVENLARQSGLLKAETKKEEQVAKKLAKDIIRTHLGDEYKNVADKLGTAIEEILSERDNAIKTEFGKVSRSQAEAQFNSDFDSFISANEVTDEEAALISKQMEIMQPRPGTSLKTFLSQQLELVRFRTGKETGNKEKLKRQAENFQRRGSTVGQESSEKTTSAPKSFSIRDAVHAASRGEKWS